jgi:hypothetical protein
MIANYILGPAIILAGPELIIGGAGLLETGYWKILELAGRSKVISILLGLGGRELADGDDDEIRVIQAGEQLVERGIGGGGAGSGWMGPGFSQTEENMVRSVANRFSQLTGIDLAGLRYWRYDYGMTGYAASGSPAGISFTDDFFTLSQSKQLHVFAEEYLHVLQGLNEFGPDTAALAHEEINAVLQLLLSLQ